MLDAHPPFQIDGNFGGVSGMTEMLLQSQNNEIHLLPALPDAWANGNIKGLRARGGFEVNVDWANVKLKTATVKSLTGSMCSIRSATPFKVKGSSAKYEQKDGNYLATFPTTKGSVYTITSK